MKRSVAFMFATVAALSAGFLLLDETDAFAPPHQIIEERVHANLVRVRINGSWENFPLTPLAEQTCSIQDELFLRYCE